MREILGRLYGWCSRMVERRKIALVVLVACLFVGGGFWQLRSLRERRVQPYTPDQPALRLNHVIFHGIANGKIVWEVYAEHVDLTNDQQTFVVGGLKKMEMLRDGKQELSITAEGLQQDVSTGDINISGSVTVLGKDLTINTPGISWIDRIQTLLIPRKLSAQFGDIAVVTENGARYNLNEAQLTTSGKLRVSCGGNVISAGGLVLDGQAQQFTVKGPVHVTYDINDVQQWAAGKNLPHLPDIPEQVKARYRAYARSKGL